MGRLKEKAFSFHDLDKYQLSNSPDLTLMVFNMEHKFDQEPGFSDDFWLPVDNLNLSGHHSNEAVMGDLNTM